MKQRSVAVVILLSFVTFGIYPLYWFVSTKDEMVSFGADIPTGWLLIIPLVNIYWMWKWSEGVEHVTRGKMTAAVSMLLLMLLGVVGTAILQATFNKTVVEQSAALPFARVV